MFGRAGKKGFTFEVFCELPEMKEQRVGDALKLWHAFQERLGFKAGQRRILMRRCQAWIKNPQITTLELNSIS